MSPVVLKTRKSLIETSAKTWHCMGARSRTIVTEENLDFVDCRYNEHYEQVKKTLNENY